MKLESRRPSSADHFNVAPKHLLRMSGAERLHCGFFGGEPAGKMNCRDSPPLTVRHLAVREDSMEKTVAVPCDCFRNPMNVCRVEPKPDDIWHAG